MHTKHPNPLTLIDLKGVLTGLATQDDLNTLATPETLNALTTKVTTVTETLAETKEHIIGLTGLM